LLSNITAKVFIGLLISFKFFFQLPKSIGKAYKGVFIMQRSKYLAVGIVCFILGATLLQPISAATNATAKWVKRYFYTKKLANRRYLTKTSANRYFLKKKDAASSYLTNANALSTYLTQSGASTTYFPLTGGTLTGSVTASDYNYSSVASKTYTVNAVTFVPLSDLVISYSGVNLGIYKSGGTSGEARASVNLPNGAVVTGVTTYYYDNDDTGKWIEVQLLRDTLSTASQNGMTDTGALGSGTPGNTSSTDNSVDYATIDNDTYSYHINAVLSSSNANCTLRHVKINYTIAKP